MLPPSDPDELGRWVETLIGHGWCPVPLVFGEKRPFHPRWQLTDFTVEMFLEAVQKRGQLGIGLRLVGLIAFDIDCDDRSGADALERAVTEAFGQTPAVRQGRWPRRTLFYRASGVAGFKAPDLDVMIAPFQCVAFNLHPDTHEPYLWIGDGGSPLDMRVEDLPEVSPEALARFRTRFGRMSAPDSQPTRDRLSPAFPGAAISLPGVPSTGPLRDGRYRLLRDLTWAELGRFKARGRVPAPEELASAVWPRFRKEADLTIPKRKGGRLYTFGDAVRCAKSSIEREARCEPARNRKEWPKARKDRLLEFIERDRRISTLGVSVAAVLLEHVNEHGIAFPGADTIAGKLGVSREAVHRNRKQLITLGYFEQTGRMGRATAVRPVAKRVPWAENPETLTLQGKNTRSVIESVTITLSSSRGAPGLPNQTKTGDSAIVGAEIPSARAPVQRAERRERSRPGDEVELPMERMRRRLSAHWVSAPRLGLTEAVRSDLGARTNLKCRRRGP